MRSVRPLFLIATCLCLAAVLTSCGSPAKGAGQETSGTSHASRPEVVTSGTAGPASVPVEPQSNKYYVVDFGDSLGLIAERFGVSVAALTRLNDISNPDEIYVGQRLLLPANAVEATVVPVPIESAHVPILMYHHIGTLSADAGSDWYSTTVTPEAFDEQMAYLAYHGYNTVKVMDLVDATEGRKALPQNPVVITFDDGWIDDYVSAFPVLQQYGMIASFFIPASWIGNLGDSTMSWAQIEELSRAGMEIGSHSMTHPYLTQSEPDVLTWELEGSKALLEEHTVGPVEVLAYPFGLYDDNVMAQTQAAGYRAALTVEEGLFDISDNLLQMPRLNVPYGGDLDTFKALLRAAGTEDASGG
jgi:peptidoglycan/xylan/chitin deacetylase (PgdA/CDA1 family)